MAQNDLLEKFIENERKAKRWTLLSTIVIALLVLTVVFFNAKLSRQKSELQNKNHKIDSMIADADSVNDLLEQMNAVSQKRLSNVSQEIDSLKSMPQTELVKNILVEKQNEKKQAKAISNFVAKRQVAVSTPDSGYGAGTDFTMSMPTGAARAVVYVQYAKGYAEKADTLRKLLLPYYTVPAAEYTAAFSGGSQIRYFHQADKEQAINIQHLLNYINIKARTVYVSLSAPSGQLEVWLGNQKKKIGHAKTQSLYFLCA